MKFEMEGTPIFTPDPGQWTRFTSSPDGEVGKDLRKRGRKLLVLATASVGKETGALARSLGMTYYAAPNPYVMVGSENSKALMVHEGTKPHLIMDAPGQMMRFKIRGRVVYAHQVKHPGTRPQRYLTRHLRKVVND